MAELFAVSSTGGVGVVFMAAVTGVAVVEGLLCSVGVSTTGGAVRVVVQALRRIIKPIDEICLNDSMI